MHAVFLASRQPGNSVGKWATSLQSSGASVRHISAWSGAGEASSEYHGSACNVDTFLLGPDASLESHIAQYCVGDGLQLISLEPSLTPLPRAGIVLLLWQPQVPHDIVQACSAMGPFLTDGSGVKGLLLVDPSPSLTLSVTHKALEGAGLQKLARKLTVLATRTTQAPHATIQALQHLAEQLPLPLPVQPSPLPNGSARIAVARDETFGPCFHENLTLLQQCGAQLLFFSPLYDAAIPAGASCLYLSSAPLEADRWQQLAANRSLLAAVRAFCEAGGLVLAEGAGLLYLSRTLDLDEGEGGSKHSVLDMAGVLPFKTRLLAEPQTAPVQLQVATGNPLLPIGSRPRGYLCAQASIVVVEERPLQSLVFSEVAHKALGINDKVTSQSLSTTYEVTVMQPPNAGVASAAAPEGYSLLNVLASSCFIFLPSQQGLATHWLRRCAGIDVVALASGMAQLLSGAMVAASALKLPLPSALVGSTTGSLTVSRRQSIQDVSAMAMAFSSNGDVSAGSSCSLLTALAGSGLQPHQQQLPYHHLMHGSSLAACGSQSGNHPQPLSNLYQSGSAVGISNLALTPHPHPQLSGPDIRLPSVEVGPACQPSRSPPSRTQTPATSPLPLTHNGRSALALGVRHEGTRAPQESSGKELLATTHLCQQQQLQQLQAQQGLRTGLGAMADDSKVSQSSCPTVAFTSAAHIAGKPKVSPAECCPPGWTQVAACGATAANCPRSNFNCFPLEMGGPCASCRNPSTADCGGRVLQASMSPATSTGSFTTYGGVGSSCSFPEWPFHHSTSLMPSLLGPGSVGWGSGVSMAGAPPASVPRYGHHGSVLALAPLTSAVAVTYGGVVCCVPGACEALVAMGLANRLVGIGSDCDHPPDVCTTRRVVLGWVPQDEAPQGAAGRGVRVVMPSGHSGAVAYAASLTLGLGGRGGRFSVERVGAGRSAGVGRRALLLDELTLRQEHPSVLVLPDPAELSEGELEQLEQALMETGLANASGGSSGACCILHTRCRTLVDIMDFILELGAALEETPASSALLERLQSRTRRVAAAAAAAVGAGSSTRLLTSPGVSAMPSSSASKCPRVLVLQSLQPLVEPGRWVPEMLALVGASSCLAKSGGSDVPLTWHDVRTKAAPNVIIILTSPGSVPTDGGAGAGSGLTQGSAALQEQLAALAAQPGWWCLPAVLVSQVYLMQSPYFIRPGPRLVDGLELLARLLLPGHYSSSRKVPPGAVMRLSLAAGQRCRATLLPSYFVPVKFN